MEKVSSLEDLFFPSDHHKFFRDTSIERVTWEEVIDNIDRNVCEDVFPEIILKDNLGVVCHDTRDMLKSYPIRQAIKKTRPHVNPTCHLYVSLTSVSHTFGKHDDFMDVLIWQCLGITRWTIYDDEVVQYDLKPGEFLYIPMGMFHDTTPLTPRASLSFGLEARPPVPVDILHFNNER